MPELKKMHNKKDFINGMKSLYSKIKKMMPLLLLSSIGLLPMACIDSNVREIIWIKHKIGEQPQATYLYVADIDGDDELDIVSANTLHMGEYESEVAWFRNNGTDSWEKVIICAPGGSDPIYNATGVVVSDIDKDGSKDIVVAASGSGEGGGLYWFQAESEPTGTWIRFDLEIEADDTYWKVYTIDPNEDGNPDIIIGGSKSAYIFVNPGNPSEEGASWGEKIHLPKGTGGCINLDDMNNDGRTDLLSSNYNSKKIAWVDMSYTAGTFSFTEHVVYEGLTGAFDIMGIDINSDGMKDMVVTKIMSAGIHWFEALSEDGGEWTVQFVNEEFEAADVYTGDINSDGQTDIAVAGYNMGMGSLPDSLAWFEYKKDGDEFTWEKHYIDENTINAPGDVSLNDMNGDGYLDLVTVSYKDGEILWYESK
jgi:hypothetical protein